CVAGTRIVQVDRKSKAIRDEEGVRAKFGVAPAFIADYLALVGDAADGYPGIAGIGKTTAARLIALHGHIEQFPDAILDAEKRKHALLFKRLATLRDDAPLFSNVDEIRWRGPPAGFEQRLKQIGIADERLVARARKAPVA